MTKNELVESLKEKIPDLRGSEEEKEIKTVLYIFLELGKIKSLDERYFFGNSEMRKKIQYLTKKDLLEVDQIVKKRRITCVSLTRLYKRVLKDFDIQVVEGEPDLDDHVYPIVITKSGKSIIADVQADLENIQTKSEIKNFYIKDEKEKEIPLTNYLIELGYIHEEKDYKNKKIDKLIKEVKGKDPHQILEMILMSEDIYDGNSEMGIAEINKYYKRILSKARIENNCIEQLMLFNCYKENAEEEKNYTACAISEYKGTIKSYLYSSKENRFLKVEIGKLIELEKQGLVLGARPKEKGSRKLKRYMKQQEKKKVEQEEIK